MNDERTSMDIHSRSPRVVFGKQIRICYGNVWARLEGLEYQPGWRYRMIKDRRGSRGYGEWLIAESKDWSREHLKLVKETILKNDEYGFSICSTIRNEDNSIIINVYPQHQLSIEETEVVNQPGFYIYRNDRNNPEPYKIDDIGSELVILTGIDLCTFLLEQREKELLD